MYSYISAEERVPENHPLRPIRTMVDAVLREMSRNFARLYAKRGRPSIPPERLLRALLLQVLFSIRSERMLMEQLDYNLLYRWFVGLNMDDEVWDATVFTKNRDRLLRGEIAQVFFQRVVDQARAQQLLSDEHFTVDGTLIEAWAGQKSFQRKPDDEPPSTNDGGSNPTVNFRGEKRANATHQSTTDPEARLFKKSRGAEAKLGYLGHVLMENRNGLVVNTRVTQATGTAERDDASQRSQILISSHSPFVMCEAWNGEDRDFIHQMKIENGQCVVRKLSDVIAQNAGPLGKDKVGGRTVLSLRNAAELMSGYLQ
jgi:transposase